MAIPSSGRRLAADSVRTFIARMLVTALSLATGIVVAKTLGPTGKGQYSGVLMVVALVMMIPAGFGYAVTYALTKLRQPLSQLLPALTVVLVGLTAVACAGAGVWGYLKGWNPLLTLFILAVPPSIILAWQSGIYIGIDRLRNLNVQSAFLAVATLGAVTLTLALLHGSAVGALAASVLCMYGAAAVVVWHVLRLSAWPSESRLVSTLQTMAHFGGQSSLNQFLGALNYRIDSLILIAMLGTSSFGIYSIAVNCGEALFWLSRPVATAVSRDIGVRGLQSSSAMTARVIRVCTAFVALVALVAELAGPWVVDMVFGSRFREAGLPLRILLPGIVVFSTAGVFAVFFLLQVGKPLIVSAVNVAMIVVQSIACVLLVPRFGMAGAAAASTATYILGAVLNTVWFCRASGLRPAEVWIINADDIQLLRSTISAGWQAVRRRPATVG
ncbi:MAG: polysaccharide biosynthesis C-terminal domain-containing protein [Candidatus Eremiobacteraeota bacterium]|nr:polysaccharide biosynthesis C-terminal domain-containing protein [Candidatus Eremiobacteraeota bacterium]